MDFVFKKMVRNSPLSARCRYMYVCIYILFRVLCSVARFIHMDSWMDGWMDDLVLVYTYILESFAQCVTAIFKRFQILFCFPPRAYHTSSGCCCFLMILLISPVANACMCVSVESVSPVALCLWWWYVKSFS